MQLFCSIGFSWMFVFFFFVRFFWQNGNSVQKIRKVFNAVSILIQLDNYLEKKKKSMRVSLKFDRLNNYSWANKRKLHKRVCFFCFVCCFDVLFAFEPSVFLFLAALCLVSFSADFILSIKSRRTMKLMKLLETFSLKLDGKFNGRWRGICSMCFGKRRSLNLEDGWFVFCQLATHKSEPLCKYWPCHISGGLHSHDTNGPLEHN